MEFAVIAYDGKDEGAQERRMAVRESHLALVETLRDNLIHGGAILDDSGKMIGSIIICDFPSREALDEWLQKDPYVTGKVWEDIQVLPFRTAPSFMCNLPARMTAAKA